MKERKKESADKQQKNVLSSIKTKLIAVMIGIVAIPVIIITIVSTLISRRSSIGFTESLNDSQAHLVEQAIASKIDQNMRALEAVALSPSTIDYLKGSTEAEARVLVQIQGVDQSFEDGNVIAITGSDGMQRVKSAGDLVDVSDREYFKQAMSGAEYVSDVQVSKSNGTLISTFAVPVKADDGTVVGIVQRNYNLSVFREMLVAEVAKEGQDLLIADTKGLIIAHSSHDVDPNELEDQSANPFYTDSRGDKTSGSYDVVWQGEKWMVSWFKEAKTGWVVASCRVTSVVLRSVNITTNILVGLGIGFVIAFGIFAFFISKSFTKPIEEIKGSMEALSNGSFLEITSFADRQDEFGDIIREINAVIGRLRGIVSNIKHSAMSVNDSSEALTDMSVSITQTSGEVSNAVQEIAGGVTQQAEDIQDAVENTAMISRNIKAVTENAESVAKTAEEMSKNSEETKAQIHKMEISSEEMGDAINEITEKISATEAAVERISGKVEAIDSIATQTNLLALNASIEAARAGEVGKGFAVVAEEIGKLADESAASANDIRMEMALLLKESQSAVEMAKNVNATTEEEQKQILKDTVKSIEKLIKGIEASVAGIDSINASAERCEASKAVVNDSMNNLSAISQEHAATSEETAASMEQLGGIITSMAEDAKALKEISNSLIEDVKFFKD